MPQDDVLKLARGNAQRKADEVFRFVLDGENSLTLLLIKAYRAGVPVDKCDEVFDALGVCVTEAQRTFHAAIVQPEPKVGGKSRVVL